MQYVAFNYWTFQDETPDIDEKVVHRLSAKSLGEIVSTDDTLDVVNAIEERIRAYAEILMQHDYIARSYNEDGDVIDGEDNMISLCGFPGIFLSIDDATKIYQKRVLKDSHYDCSSHLLSSAFRNGIKDKFPIKFVIKPETLLCDKYSELLTEEGIDVREDFIEGIVDIGLLSAELKKRGISMTFTAENYSNFKKATIRGIKKLQSKMNLPDPNSSYELERLLANATGELDSNSEYLLNLLQTRMSVSVNVSKPLSQIIKQQKRL